MLFQKVRKGLFYFIINFFRVFERLVILTYQSQSLIPVAFILGFYIHIVFNRFWLHFCTIPWGLKFSMALVANLPGSDERPRLIRRTCIRYVLASLIVSCTRLNLVAKRRFPTSEHFVYAGKLELLSYFLISIFYCLCCIIFNGYANYILFF